MKQKFLLTFEIARSSLEATCGNPSWLQRRGRFLMQPKPRRTTGNARSYRLPTLTGLCQVGKRIHRNGNAEDRLAICNLSRSRNVYGCVNYCCGPLLISPPTQSNLWSRLHFQLTPPTHPHPGASALIRTEHDLVAQPPPSAACPITVIPRESRVLVLEDGQAASEALEIHHSDCCG